MAMEEILKNFYMVMGKIGLQKKITVKECAGV